MRNATRHGSPSRLDISVEVTRTPARVTLTVEDDGTGFDTSQSAAADSFGLRGLRDLAREAHGTLTVESRPGHGTTVSLEVPGR